MDRHDCDLKLFLEFFFELNLIFPLLGNFEIVDFLLLLRLSEVE